MSEEDPEKAEAEEASETEETQEPDSNNNSKSGTVNLSVNTVIIGAFVLGLTVGFSGGVLTKGNALAGLVGTQEAPAPSQPSDQQGQQGNTDIVDLSQINMSGEPVLGESDAPVTMVIYEDFECPFCKRFEDNAFQNIKSNYVDTGQVKVIWKDRPLTSYIHGRSRLQLQWSVYTVKVETTLSGQSRAKSLPTRTAYQPAT